MALKRYKNGTFEVTSTKAAIEAYELMQERVEAISELEKEHGIDELRQDATNLKLSADTFLKTKGKSEVEIPKLKKVAKVIRGFDGQWIATRKDLIELDTPSGAKSLKSIVGSKMVKLNNGKKVKLWNYITKRVVDPEALTEAVANGMITEKEISKAYVEKPREPYVRLFDNG